MIAGAPEVSRPFLYRRPPSRFNETAFSDPEQIREKAPQKARATTLPDPESMTSEEIRQLLHDMHVKQIEAESHIERLQSGLKEYGDQLSLLTTITDNMFDLISIADMDGNYKYIGASRNCWVMTQRPWLVNLFWNLSILMMFVR